MKAIPSSPNPWREILESFPLLLCDVKGEKHIPEIRKIMTANLLGSQSHAQGIIFNFVLKCCSGDLFIVLSVLLHIYYLSWQS